MKKVLYLFLIIPLIFSSCSKEDEDNTPDPIPGCMDVLATNYNANATQDNGSCLYSIVGVWSRDQVIINNQDVTALFQVLNYTFYDDNSTYYEAIMIDGTEIFASETWSLVGSTLTCVDNDDGDILILNVDLLNGTQLHLSGDIEGDPSVIHLVKQQ